MLRLAARHNLLASSPRLLATDNARKFLAFERAGCIFLFNLHVSEALTDFPVIVPPQGEWRWALDTDATDFGGFGRIQRGGEYPVFIDKCGKEAVRRIRIYLPPRTALVLSGEAK